MVPTVCALPLLALALALALAPVSAKLTTETFEQAFAIGKDSPVIGWTIRNDSSVSFTVIHPTLTVGWLGAGVSQSSGLGMSLMQKGGAVVTRPTAILSQPIDEYSLDLHGATLWSSAGASLLEIGSCLSSFCSTELGKCAAVSVCNDALNCVKNELANGSFSGGNDTVSKFIRCGQYMTNQADQLQNQGFGAFLAGAGCFLANCAIGLSSAAIRVPGVAGMTYVQDSSGTVMRFVSINGSIGGVQFPLGGGSAVSLLLAFGTDANKFTHDPSTAAAVSLDMTTGLALKNPAPDWVTLHAGLMTASFGVALPVGAALRGCAMRGAFTTLFFSLVVAVVGAGVASVYVPVILPTDVHSLLGVVTLVIACFLPVVWLFKPAGSGMVFDEATKKFISNQEEQASAMRLWGGAMSVLELLTLALTVVVAFLGEQAVRQSEVLEPAGLIVLPLVCVGGLVGAVVARVLAYLRRRGTAAAARSQQQVALGSPVSSPGGGPSSNNPGFKRQASALQMDGEDEDEDDGMMVLPMYLTFSNVTYHAPATRSERREGVQGKLIVQGMSGLCAPRTLTAIMGPSGAGKSTLLDILALRVSSACDAGSLIAVNGVPADSLKAFRRLSGYVLQHDILHPYLTVFETLHFTASMVFPTSMSASSRYARVLRVVAQLALGHVVDTKVGNESIRGLSGGERRRVSIGIQIIKSPSLLFLDEPTSGLDAHMAGKIILALRELANEGRTIIATIHQPSASTFECFDRLILLSAGRLVFSGSRTQAEQFFAEAGRAVPNRWNPADWYVTVVDTLREKEEIVEPGVANQKRASYRTPESKALPAGMRPAERAMRVASHSEAPADVADLRDAIMLFYKKHNPEKLKSNPEVVEEITQYALRKGIAELDRQLVKTYGAGLQVRSMQKAEPVTPQELDAICRKFATSAYANEDRTRTARVRQEVSADVARSSLSKSPQGLVFMKQMGLAEGEQQHEQDSADTLPIRVQIRHLMHRALTISWRDPSNLTFQSLQNLFFGILLGTLYSNLRGFQSHALIIANVMAILLAMVGFVTTALGSATQFSDKLVFEREQSDNLYAPAANYFARIFVGVPVDCVIGMCLILPAYFLIGLKPDGLSFIFFLLVNLAVIFVMDSVVYVACLVSKNVDIAFALGNFNQALAILFCGVFIPVYVMPKPYQWIYFVSPFSYAFAAVALNQFEDTPDEWFLTTAGVAWRSKWGNLAVVFGMGLLWRALGFFVMQSLFRKKSGHREPAAGSGQQSLSPATAASGFMGMSPLVGVRMEV
jgi:ABC-type multidrug transport system ATPase subunit